MPSPFLNFLNGDRVLRGGEQAGIPSNGAMPVLSVQLVSCSSRLMALAKDATDGCLGLMDKRRFLNDIHDVDDVPREKREVLVTLSLPLCFSFCGKRIVGGCRYWHLRRDGLERYALLPVIAVGVLAQSVPIVARIYLSKREKNNWRCWCLHYRYRYVDMCIELMI